MDSADNNCYDCDHYCKTCSKVTKSTCDTCDISMNRNDNPGSSCTCKNKFYDNGSALCEGRIKK